MRVALCTVFAALLALVSAVCDLDYHSGDLCNDKFCDNVKTYMETCKGETFAPHQAAEGEEKGPRAFTDEDKKKFHEGCEKMQKCVTDKITEEEDKVEYKRLTDFCEATTSEENHEVLEGGKRINYDMCLKMNTMQCCKIDFGGKHGGHGKHGGPPPEGGFVTPEKQFMSMFF